MKNKVSFKFILFYLSWTIMFTIIPMAVIQPEKITLGIIFFSLIISAILSIPVTYYFYKVLNRKIVKSDDIPFGLLTDEKIILKANASTKKGILMLGGSLYLTNKRILLIGTEFFDRNKKLINLPLHSIESHELDDNYQLQIREASGRYYIIILEDAFNFVSELSKVLQ